MITCHEAQSDSGNYLWSNLKSKPKYKHPLEVDVCHWHFDETTDKINVPTRTHQMNVGKEFEDHENFSLNSNTNRMLD